jgi:hypothetical protein
VNLNGHISNVLLGNFTEMGSIMVFYIDVVSRLPDEATHPTSLTFCNTKEVNFFFNINWEGAV